MIVAIQYPSAREHRTPVAFNLILALLFIATAPAAAQVYVYRFNGVEWTRTQKLFPLDDPANSGWFGFSLAVDSHLVAIGPPQAHRSGAHSGAVCIFRLEGNE